MTLNFSTIKTIYELLFSSLPHSPPSHHTKVLSSIGDNRARDREAVSVNTRMQVAKIKAEPLIAKKAAAGEVMIVGAFYEITSGSWLGKYSATTSVDFRRLPSTSVDFRRLPVAPCVSCPCVDSTAAVNFHLLLPSPAVSQVYNPSKFTLQQLSSGLVDFYDADAPAGKQPAKDEEDGELVSSRNLLPTVPTRSLRIPSTLPGP